ncbi:hypothetical protein [Streptomyces anulatus]|uniref:hypothetical protein n=1 Tax=Streptomyces anulatus TaxID=1892 RepID=UPI00369B8F64
MDIRDEPGAGKDPTASDGRAPSATQKVRAFLRRNRTAISTGAALAASIVVVAVSNRRDPEFPALDPEFPVLDAADDAFTTAPSLEEEDSATAAARHARAHRMKLRPGANASQSARDAYREATNEELPPGETYRRAY